MKSKRLLLAASLALWSILGCTTHRTANLPQQSTNGALDEATFSKIKAGSSTRAEVRALLGAPWRATNYGETYCGCPHTDLQEVWEYRGVDSKGPYKLHIEFDADGITQILAVGYYNGVVRILASMANDAADSKGNPGPAHAEHILQSGGSAQAQP